MQIITHEQKLGLFAKPLVEKNSIKTIYFLKTLAGKILFVC